VRAAFKHPAGNFDLRLARVVTFLFAPAARIIWSATRLCRVSCVLARPPVGGPFPGVANHVVDAVAIGRECHHRRGTTRLALPSMIANKWGRIINIASAHGLVASPYKSAYVAAKHGLVGLTKVTALETAEQGITCNAVCPGYVYTPLVEAQIDAQAKAHSIPREKVIRDVLLGQQPNKRFATVEELGALSVFLASDAAASITGIALPVDGGWTAH
jgi:NAD(P)-dependent dehydrogenase (short-subunit alcohol dehydrogenase family)